MDMFLFKPGRRDLLRKAMLAGSSVALSGWWPGLSAFAQTNPLLPQSGNPNQFSYLTGAELAFIDAALDRLIPTDQLGPGARAAGVAFFIDQQLAGPYGRASRWYMQGPWRDGTKQQGYQLKLTPAQLYRLAIATIDAHCQRQYGNKTFAQLPPQQQEEVLHALDGGKIDVPDVPLKQFFDILLDNVHQGYLADPMYGGNRNFAGWKLIGFPGPRYNYTEEITQYGARYDRPFIGLTGYDGKPHTLEYGGRSGKEA